MQRLYEAREVRVETWIHKPGDCDFTEQPLLFKNEEGFTVARIPKQMLRFALAGALDRTDTRWRFSTLLGALGWAFEKERPGEVPIAIAFPTWMRNVLRDLEWGDVFFGLQIAENLTNDDISLLSKRNFGS